MSKKIHLPLIIKQDEDGIYIISCNTFKASHSNGETFYDANENIKEVISMCMEEEDYKIH